MSKLRDLQEAEGYYTQEDMLEAAIMDGLASAICMNQNCDFVTEMEPDQDAGWCEECEENTVKSCLVIAGMI